MRFRFCFCIDIGIRICQYEGMKRISMYLKTEQLKKLTALSEKTGAPVAELIRRAIDAYLKKGA